jgi:kynurenine/2-aminoadipate aminotransferase
MISLGGGMPHGDTFPFQKMSIQLKDGTDLRVDENDMRLALQYSATNGLPELVKFLKELQLREHEPPSYTSTEAFDVCVMNGSQDGIAKVFLIGA